MNKCKHCGKWIWFWQNRKIFKKEEYPKIDKDYSTHNICHYKTWIKILSD